MTSYNILSHRYDGEGRTTRELLSDKGIDCLLVREDDDYEQIDLSTTSSNRLYTYNRISDGKKLWLIERQTFCQPDVEYNETWIIDAEPSKDDIKTIVNNTSVA